MDRRVVIRLFSLVPSQLPAKHPRATSGTVTPNEVDWNEGKMRNGRRVGEEFE